MDERIKIKLSQDREAGISGIIKFDNQEVGINGIWPLDGDLIRIEAKAELKNLTSYFDRSSVFADLVPNNATAKIGFHVSKIEKRLEEIIFDFTASNWLLLKGIFSLKDINFNTKIQHPGKLNIITASFDAKAIIGDVELLCEGNFPDGEVALGLPPGQSISLHKLLKTFSANTGFNEDAAITKLSGNYDLSTSYFSFGVGVAKVDWNPANDLIFSLTNLNLDVYGKENYSFKLNAGFKSTFNNKEVVFKGSAAYDKGWSFNGNCKLSNINMGDLVKAFGLNHVPTKLNDFEFRSLAFAFDTKLKLKYFAGSFGIRIFQREIVLDLEVKKLDETTYFTGNFSANLNDKSEKFKIEFITQDGKKSIDLQFIFNIAGVDLYLTASSSSDQAEDEEVSEKKFFGATKGLKIPLSKLLSQLIDATFGTDFPANFLPEFDINDIYVAYDGATMATNIIAYAKVGSKIIRFWLQSYGKIGDSPSSYAFGIDTDVANLGDLPLVGGEMQDVKFNGVGFISTSIKGEFTLPQLSEADKNGQHIIEFAPVTNLEKGITLCGVLEISEDADPIVLSLPVNKKQSVKLMGTGELVKGTVESNSFEPAVKWLNLNKKIGPVAVNRIGFGFEGDKLSLLISGALMLADLSLNVEGLGLSFSPIELIKGENIKPDFNLSGLGLALEKKPLEISGMLMRSKPADGELISFYGAAQISTASFSIRGIGAYAKLDKGKGDSLFVYGLYNGPIGGPTFFFVTGIAAGFGYNRKVRIPKLEEVKDFPLVAMVLGAKQLNDKDILTKLIEEHWIPTSVGSYWMAVGVRFTSFKIIESFILLTVNFGNKLEFAVMGLALLKWPNKGNALVYIELALLAKFGPDSDVVAVTGMLTPNSYLFDKNAKLTGGFAFYTWIAGEHEGDFVVTIGGYPTNYKIPAHYPTVDRLALNWKMSDALSVRGEMYFALTPKEIMAGGKWEIAHNLSFLSARVTIWANMYISWAPFHYELEAGIIVRIEANIKILFVHIHFKLQMACVVQIWGPPFAGQIYVDWSIFSFTIPFGDQSVKKIKPLVWGNTLRAGENNDEENFVSSFVPMKDKKPHIVDVRIVKGLLNEPDKAKDANDDSTAVPVNPYGLIIAVDSFLPIDNIHTATEGVLKKGLHTKTSPCVPLKPGTPMEVAGQDIPQTLKDRETNFGITPMAITKLDTQLHVWLEKVGEVEVKDNEVKAKTNTVQIENVEIIGNAKGINSALWSPTPPEEKASNNSTNQEEQPPVIKNVLSGLQLHIKEAVAGTRKEIKLDEPKLITAEAQLSLLSGSNAGSQDGGALAFIKLKLPQNVALITVNNLKQVGFDDLYTISPPIKPELLGSILNGDPVYIAALGQLLPPDSLT